ncbi:signal transduction histidine kinase [Stenotrophomonas indicatrix]|nr:signal transduction histidine kinase [Stenotrophomonas indicatrix]
MRRTLLVVLLSTLALLMGVAGFFSYRAGLQEAGEMFDARLVQSTRVLIGLVDEPLSDLTAFPGDPIVLRGWHGQAKGVGEELAFKEGHAYESKLAFQVWDRDHRLLLRSDSAPTTPLAALQPGYASPIIGGEQWRTFTMRTKEGRWFQSGERSDIREELAEDIAGGTLLPLLLALPLMALVIWWSVNFVTRSLQRVSDQIGKRDPERMSPLEATDVPREAQGLVRAVNGLLARLDEGLARERRFVADAAHELRTPISALKVHADNARMASEEVAKARAQDMVTDSVARLERLVSQLLTLNRAEGVSRLAPVRLSLDALVAVEVDALDPILAVNRQSIALNLESAEVRGDEAALTALVRNLLENAVRYTPVGGHLRVWVGQEENTPFFIIADSGPGIAAEERERVFDRFYRTLGSHVQGSGLGLSIVREVANAHGAIVTLGASAQLGGLEVKVSWPSGSDYRAAIDA